MSQTKTQLVEGLNINTSAPADALAVDNNGRVGIGTSAPSTLLHLSSATGSATPTPTELRIATTTNASDWSTTDPWGRLSFYSGDSSAGGPKIHAAITATAINTSASTSDIGFWTNAGGSDTLFQAMTIKGSSAFVGIGTASPAASLHIANSGPVLRLEDTDTNGYAQVLSDNNGSLYLDADAGNSQGSSSIRFRVDLDEKVRIDTSGRLLVGTSTPDTTYRVSATGYTPKNEFKGTAVYQLALNRTNDSCYMAIATKQTATSGVAVGGITFNQWDGSNLLNAASIVAAIDGTPGTNDMPGRLLFNTTADGASFPTERMRITNEGKVLIGTTSLSLSDPGVQLYPNGDTYYSLASGNTLHVYSTSGSQYRFYVNENGGVYNYSGNNVNLSDEREKKNIEPLDSTWNCLKNWDLKKFHYNQDADTDDKRYGVIAQQVAPHCPEVISEWITQKAEDAVVDNDGNVVTEAKEEIVRMGVKEQQMMWMAIKALQEAQTRIETLETANTSQAATIATLDARLTALEGAG